MTEMVKVNESGMKIYLRLLSYVRPFWVAFLIGIIGFLLYAGSQTAFAMLMEYLVNSISNQIENAYLMGPLALLAIAFFRSTGTYLGHYYISYVSRHVVHQIRVDMFERILVMPVQYFSENSAGYLLSKITFNVDQVTKAATESLKVSVREGATVIGLLAYLLYLNWKLTLIFAAVSPIIALVVLFAAKRFRRLGHRIQDSMGDVTHVASENIQGFQIARIFGGNTLERKRFLKASGHNLLQSLKMARTEAISTPVVQFIVSASLALLIFLALHPIFASGMDAGEFIAFITAAGLVAKPLRALTEVNSNIQKGIAAAASIFELLDTDKEKSGDYVLPNSVQGELVFKELGFSYTPEKRVIKGLNLAVAKGETVALVGKSGSGKSTLASLIPRFYDATEGEILLDGQNLKQFNLDFLREQIALVTQNVVLFSGTIRENIAYGAMENSSAESVDAAAEAAHVMEFAALLPDGLDTQVGENGTKLSGGQRQRIAIARAILKNAPVLILDEATSALDTESERHIQAAMENVMHGRTTLVIAHRLSTIESADQIVVMDQGQIIEKGTHAELLAKGKVYAGLYQKQFTENSALDSNGEIE